MQNSVVCRVGDIVRRGRTIRLHCAVEPSAVADAIASESTREDRIAVVSASPPPVYDHVGCLRSEMGLRTRTALAKAARTRDLTTSYDEKLHAARSSLSELTVSSAETEPHRREAARTAEATDRLREAVATARGRLQARQENDLDPDSAAEDLSEAIRRLSEAETSQAAAEQSLERAREVTRAHRDRREQRFRLQDRVANLERAARASLVEQLRDEYVDALTSVPGEPPDGDPFETESVTAALAIARLAESDSPLVVACDRFDSPMAASEVLDAPVIRV